MNDFTHDWMGFLLRNKSNKIKTDTYNEMIMEYRYIRRLVEQPHECEACGTSILHNYEIENSSTGKRFIVGSSCINKVSKTNEQLNINLIDTQRIQQKRMDYLKLHHNRIYQRLSSKGGALYLSEAKQIYDTVLDETAHVEVLYTLGLRVKVDKFKNTIDRTTEYKIRQLFERTKQEILSMEFDNL